MAFSKSEMKLTLLQFLHTLKPAPKIRENVEEVVVKVWLVLASLCRKACRASFLECSRLGMMFAITQQV